MRGRPAIAAAGAVVTALLLGAAVSQAHDESTDTDGHSTFEQALVGGDPSEGFSFLELGEGDPYFVREELATARAGRAERRRSLLYLSQLTDFQLTDEESPARVEFPFDSVTAPLAQESAGEPEPEEESEDPDEVHEGGGQSGASAWRPQEATVAQQVELTIRQVNRFVRSPLAQGNGKHARMLNAVMTGDLADSQQRNETAWVIRLLEGGRLHPNSGSGDPRTYDPACRALVTSGQLEPKEAPRYTGVQDYDDYFESQHFYDPEKPLGIYKERGWPTYPGLMDAAQEPFRARGLKVPSYVVYGNHDGLVQGNEDANAVYEAYATGCLKPLFTAPAPNPVRLADVLDPAYAESLLTSDPSRQLMVVPPDERRQYVDRSQFKRLNDTGHQADTHGFAYVDRDELRASDGSAAYYSFSPKDGIRYIVLDTVGQGGSFVFSPNPESEGTTPTVTTDEGNIDHPQWRWLRQELDKASRRDELITVFSHHAPSNMFYNQPDEGGGVPPCVAEDGHGHDVNPGCDIDPRSSSPLHFGDDLVRLLIRHENVIANVAGHSHTNRAQPFENRDGGGYWEIRTASITDWPPQSRLIEVMDNRDGTLSIFTTILDHAAPATAPTSGTPGDELGLLDLASIGRTLSYNDPQVGPGEQSAIAPGPGGSAEDRNTELLVPDPREGMGPHCDGLRATRIGTGGKDRLRGTPGRDVVVAGGGDDVITTGDGKDVVCAGMGDDTVRTGAGGDRVLGNRGHDRVRGRRGPDKLFGNRGADRLRGARGDDFLSGGRDRDRLRGGRGDDRLRGGQGRDELRGGPGDDTETR